MGGNGGCGEFDILEGVIGNDFSDMLFTQVYDFKGAGSPGTMKYFQRPSVGRLLFRSHFDAVIIPWSNRFLFAFYGMLQ